MVLRRTPLPARPSALEPPPDARALLSSLYWTAVEAAAPRPVTFAALSQVELPPSRRVWIIALGKAAHGMASAAVEWLGAQGVAPAGGIIIAPTAAVPPHPSLLVAVGDHPIPGRQSLAAATKLGDVVARVHAGDETWVLLSGGASSLAAAPESAIRPAELAKLFWLLLNAGLDISRTNTIRKRFMRWGAGRLAAALHPARVRNFIISDVLGDDLSAIGSGPCTPDPSRATNVRAMLEETKLWTQVPVSLRRYLTVVEKDSASETPKPRDPIFDTVERQIIANNRLALQAASARAAEYGLHTRVMTASLKGHAAEAGQRVANTLISYRGPANDEAARIGRLCLLWGGETTVDARGSSGVGGRCQELALAAARELSLARAGAGDAAILAAGSDGRDGPTDAAGAIVNAETWNAISRAGADPRGALETHDSYRALDAAGALLRTGHTGTNVMDIVIGVVGTTSASGVL